MGYNKIPTEHYQNLGGMNQKVSKYLTGIMEFLNLVNFDLSTPGAITKRDGSTQYAFSGGTQAITSLGEYNALNGASKIMFTTNNGIFSLNKGSTPISLMPTFVSGNVVDMQMFVNWMWITGASGPVRFNGNSAYAVGLPSPGGQGLAHGFSTVGQSTGFFITTQYAIGLVNSRGYRSPPIRSRNVSGSAVGGLSTITLGFTPGDRLGHTAFTRADYTALFGATCFAAYRRSTTGGSTLLQGQPFFHVQDFSIGASFWTDTFGDTNLAAGEIFFSEAEVNGVLNPWVPSPTDSAGDGFITSGTTMPLFSPRMLEIHQNSMFYSGYTLFPSSVWFSEVGDPETVQADYSMEVRTNDGDIVRCMKSLGSQLLVFKENSFHKVVGDNPENYELIEISTEYGCISNKAAVTSNGKCYFIDPKGVVEYNGAGHEVVSKRVESVFRRMNLSAARDNACAVHYDFKEQLWFCFPVDGAGYNNIAVVYDYGVDAWYTYNGFFPSSLLRAEGGLNTKAVFMGDYSGMVHYFSPSFYSDNGNAFTLIAQPGFMQPQGKSVEALFRKLWVDSDVVSGPTGRIEVQLLSNMSSTGITTMSVYQNQFQSRLEFGVQAKAFGVIFTHSHASLPCRINGWAVAHRWLRDL